DPGLQRGALRGKNRAEMTQILESWMKTFPTDAAVLETLERHRVPVAPVLSVADTVTHPYFSARDMVRRVPDVLLGDVTIPGFPLKFSAFPELPVLAAPLLGEHNGAVLKEYLGFDDARLQALGVGG